MRDRIYKTAKFWKVTSYVLIPILMFPFGFLVILPFIADYINFDLDLTIYKWFFAPFSVLMLFLIVVIFDNTINGKFVISNNKIFTKGLFNNKQLYFDEINGFRKRDHFTFVESKNSSLKIKISNYYENVSEIFEWLNVNYIDLDLAEKNQDSTEILKNYEFGWTIEQREQKLITAQKTAKILNWLGTFISIGTVLLLSSYKYIILICVAYPIICMFFVIKYKGLITIDERPNTAYPTLFWAFLAPSFVLILRGLMFYKVFDYANIWIPTILIVLGFILMLKINNKGYLFYKAEKKISVLTLIIFVLFGYSYGTVINLNCVLDNSKPKVFKTIILKKTVTSGRNTSYNLKLAKWNNQIESKEVSVTEDFYDKKKVNDTVTINLKKGKLNIPWFELYQE